MGRDRQVVTFAVGQGVSCPLSPDGLGQVERLLRRRADVLYRRDGRLCRRRVSVAELALWQDAAPLLYEVTNPFGRAVPREPQAKAYRLTPGAARPPRGSFRPGGGRHAGVGGEEAGVVSAKAIRYGCRDPECGYTTAPSTMGTPYRACPLCGGAWTADPPARVPPQMTVQEFDPKSGKDVGKPKPIPPHLASLYAARCQQSPARPAGGKP